MTGGALTLPNLHTPGTAQDGEAGGVLFFHGPADPESDDPRRFEGPFHRRYDPRRLPKGWTQALGHIRDGKCRTLLGGWSDGAPALDGPLRSLLVHQETVRYGRGVKSGPPRTTRLLIFLDGGMLHAPIEEYELLNLSTRQPLQRRHAH